MKEINQCDGCRRHLPVNHNGIHIDLSAKHPYGRLYMVCVSGLYKDEKKNLAKIGK